MANGSQLHQTLESSFVLPPAADPAKVRVLVVDWRGLVKVLAPGAESPVEQALRILHSLGLKNNVATKSQSALKHEVTTKELVHQVTVDDSWTISLLSVHHQPSLVLVKVGWEPYHDQLIRNDQMNVSYLVSWTAEGDVVKGNLLTNTSVVTLSLWPDTTYRVQVALFSLELPSVQSAPLIVDTHVANTSINSTSSPSTTTRLPEQVHVDQEGNATHYHIHHAGHHQRESSRSVGVGAGREVVAGVCAAVLVFLAVVMTSTWRWRHRLYLPHRKLLDEEADAPNIYRVFPPVMRLMGESDRSSDLFSSRDNLLLGQ